MASFPQPAPNLGFQSEERKNSLFGSTMERLEEISSSLTFKQYRARQLWHGLYRQRISSLDELATLPLSARIALTEAGYKLGLPEIVQTFTSDDGTERYLVACADGETVETVWMPNGDNGERGDGSEAAIEEEPVAPASVRFAKGGANRFPIAALPSAFPARSAAPSTATSV